MDSGFKTKRQKPAALIYRDILMATLVAACVSMYYELWTSLRYVGQMQDIVALYVNVSSSDVILFLCAFVFMYAMLRVVRRQGVRIADFVYKWRYAIGGAVVLLLVILNLSGSSVHSWAHFVGTEENGLRLGMERLIRSDEWLVSTPFAFSQVASGYHYFSPVIAGGADAFLLGTTPVLDIGIIFKPFYWGYLLLGAERGLSFYWNIRLICLLLLSFDFAMLITDNKRFLSLLFSLLVSFSPCVQWWAATGIEDLLITGFAAVILINRYLCTTNYKIRVIYALLLTWCGVIYALVLYPAWIVPIAYVLLAVLIPVFILNRKRITLSLKDAGIVASVLLLAAVSLGYVFIKSKEAVQLIMNTVYPGKRVGSSTYGWQCLFLYPSGLFSTFKQDFPGTNVCEISSFISFFPVGLILFIRNTIKRRKADAISTGLVIVSVFMALYCHAGLPESILTITLLKYSTTGRTLPILMLAQIMLLFREIAVSGDIKTTKSVSIFSVVVAAAVVYFSSSLLEGFYSLSMQMILVVLMYTVCIASLEIGNHPELIKTFGVCIAFVVLIGGVFVNPIQQGAKEVLNNQMTQTVAPVVEKDPDGRWIVEGSLRANAILPAGARTINCTNIYPNMELWHKIDENGEYEDVYNRYAHVRVVITPEDTAFQLTYPDSFALYINPNDLEAIQTDYILTDRNLEELNTDSTRFTLEHENGGLMVYRVESV